MDTNPSGASQTIPSVTILVVDDERTNLKAVEIMLSSLKHNIVSLTSGEAALDFLGTNPDIALIILDIHMPDMDGFEVVQNIQKLTNRDYVPIIFLTGSATDVANVFQGYQKGAVDYLDRKVPPQVLRSKVSAFVELYLQSQKIKDQTQKLQDSNKALSDKILEHTKTLAIVKEKEEELRTFFDQANDLIHSINQSGQFLYVNQYWLDTLGYTADEVVNLYFLDIIHPSNHDYYQEVFQALLKGQPQEKIEVIFVNKSGKQIYVEGNINCYFRGNEFIATRGIFRDITQRKQAEEKMQAALVKEKEVSELRSRFVSTASHEFRTPLTGILSSTELLQTYWNKFTFEEQQEYLEQIYDSAMLMRNLMNDVLLVSKAEAGRMQFNPSWLNICDSCREVVEKIQKGIGHNHQITISTENIEPQQQFNLDEKLLQLILTNLVTNAVKYSHKNTIVELKILIQDQWVVFKVKDNGEGIPVEDQPYIFDSFRRGNNTHDIPGTGLGLNIVKHSVQLHLGTISFVSNVGVGSCFTVTLPLDSSQ